MFGGKVKIKKETLERLKAAAEKLGCSVEELVEKALQGELSKLDSLAPGAAVSEEEMDRVASQLRGLGYIE